MIDLDALAKDLREAGFDTRAYQGLLMTTRESRDWSFGCVFDVREDGRVFCTGGTIKAETWRALDIIRRHVTEGARS